MDNSKQAPLIRYDFSTAVRVRCQICKWPIDVAPRRARDKQFHTCDLAACQRAIKSEGRFAPGHPRHKPHATFNCAYCGKLNQRPRVFIDGRANPCCNNTCRLALQRSGKVTKLPSNSFMLTAGAAETAMKVASMVADNQSGRMICEALDITRGILMSCLKFHNLKIARNVVRKTGANSPKWVGEVACACHHCGTVRMRKPYDIKGKERVYCDERCQHAFLTTLSGRKSARYIEPQTLICDGCGIHYDEPKNIKSGETSRFHNRSCYTKWVKQQVGERHPRWVGIGKWRGDNWPTQRLAAANRDKGICQLCDADVGVRTVDVHHIRPFKFFAESRDFAAANALSNLVSFCKKCHMAVEGRTDDANFSNWRAYYEYNKQYPRRDTGALVRRYRDTVKKLYAELGNKSAVARKLNIRRDVVYACIDGPRTRRTK